MIPPDTHDRISRVCFEQFFTFVSIHTNRISILSFDTSNEQKSWCSHDTETSLLLGAHILRAQRLDNWFAITQPWLLASPPVRLRRLRTYTKNLLERTVTAVLYAANGRSFTRRGRKCVNGCHSDSLCKNTVQPRLIDLTRRLTTRARIREGIF